MNDKGINVEELSNISIEIENKSKEINQIFNSINQQVQESNAFFSDDISHELLTKYSDISSNYNITYENLISLSDEYKRLVNNYTLENETIESEYSNKETEIDSLDW